jgi:hypothetical protein
MFYILRQESETVGAFKMATGERLPAGALMTGLEAVSAQVYNFEEAQMLDAVDGRMP